MMSKVPYKSIACLLPVVAALPLLPGCFQSKNSSLRRAPEIRYFSHGSPSAKDSGKFHEYTDNTTESSHSAPLKTLRGGSSGVALLMEAARQGNDSLVRTQLAAGVRVNASDRHGETALSHAIRHEKHNVALLLIEEGANVNLRDAQGNTPLNCLCLGPSHYTLQRDSAQSDSYALHDSFYKDRRKVFQALLDAKADTNMRDAEGVTPLMRALWYSWQPSVDTLVVDAGDNARSIEAHTFADDNSSRWTGLAAQSFADASRSGSRVESSSLSETSVGGGSLEPLRFTAVYRTEEEVINSLIAAGADPDGRNAADCKISMGSAGATPLVAAAAMGDESVVSLLLKAKADVNARDAEGRTALMHAALRGDGSMSRKLIAAGADLSLKDKSGHTAAQYAREKGFNNLASMLENPSAYRRFLNAVSTMFD